MSKPSAKNKTPPKGNIRISSETIARVAHDAALQSYGIVGMYEPGLVSRLLRRNRVPGVRVRVRKGRIIVDLYVIVQYGTRISEVAQNVMSRVKYALEQMVGIAIAEINVHVQDVRLNHETPAEGGEQA